MTKKIDPENNDSNPGKIHDKFFREVFSDLKLTREFLKQWLPEDILSRIDLNYLKALPTSMIAEILGGSEAIADLLFETKFSEKAALLQVLVEHKSSQEKFTPLQAFAYQVSAWWVYHRDHPKKKLPLIVTIVLHHGQSPYTYSTDIRDLVDAPRDLVERYVLQPFLLVDLAKIPDEAIQGPPELRLTELVLKHIRDNNLLDFLKQRVSGLLPEVIKNDKQLVISLLEYIMRGSEIGTQAEFTDFVKQSVTPVSSEVGATAMSLADRIKQEGLEKGRQEGRQEGRLEGFIETAKRMLSLGADDAFILKATGLSHEDLDKIKKK